ncbi:MAG: hypothetical protein WAM60_02455 [Candidatus Promineifilaceae bacterium]
MGLFDRLQNQLDDRAKEGGISPLDLADLSPRLRKIMRLMLREVQMTQIQLRDATAEMPEADRLTELELTEALDSLTHQGWLIRLGQDELVTYKVNLKRRSPSSLSSGIWATLESRMGPEKKP